MLFDVVAKGSIVHHVQDDGRCGSPGLVGPVYSAAQNISELRSHFNELHIDQQPVVDGLLLADVLLSVSLEGLQDLSHEADEGLLALALRVAVPVFERVVVVEVQDVFADYFSQGLAAGFQQELRHLLVAVQLPWRILKLFGFLPGEKQAGDFVVGAEGGLV